MNNLIKNNAYSDLMFILRAFVDVSLLLKKISVICPCLVVILLLTGCASNRTTHHEIVVNEKLPKPHHVWVYKFDASDAVLSEGSSRETARQAGARITAQLIEEICSMGLSAVQGEEGTSPEINDIVIKGKILSVDEGSVAKRIVLGFGLGASKLKVRAEHYQVTSQGLRKLGTIADSSVGTKSSGVALSALGLIASTNPVGLIVGTGINVYGEGSGSSQVEGRAEGAADGIAVQYKLRFEDLGLIPSHISAVAPDATGVTANSPEIVVTSSKLASDTTKTEDALLTKTVDSTIGSMAAKTSQAPPTNYYAVQLVSSVRREEVTKLLEKWQSTYNPLGIFDKTVGKQKVYVLVYGDFTSVAQAKQAIAALPEELRKNKPWLVKMIRS